MTDRPYAEQAVAGLRSLLPPDTGANEGIDWEALSAAWGTRFPSDYMEFMKVYGAGGISDSFEVVRPLSPETMDISGMATATSNARDQWPPEVASIGVTALGAGETVIAWAVTPAADVVCWLTSHVDPDQWPVAVLSPSLVAPWRVYPVGMAEFLRRLLVGEFDTCPISDSTLWNAGTGQFLHWREQERLLNAGIDPWTGEPDPYANLGFDD
ncbi:SMI1/KNR4 family protein [Streptomyces lavendofoliae]|uniref:SMI1/KNR4 family protein n=1 Tax=Streptomyces lavendofoliae TaxID=67314 RepID=UPI003D8EFD6C